MVSCQILSFAFSAILALSFDIGGSDLRNFTRQDLLREASAFEKAKIG